VTSIVGGLFIFYNSLTFSFQYVVTKQLFSLAIEGWKCYYNTFTSMVMKWGIKKNLMGLKNIKNIPHILINISSKV